MHVPVVANGSTTTAQSIRDHAAFIAEEQLANTAATVAIIGIGSVGNQVAEQLLRNPFPGFTKLLLVGRETDGVLDKDMPGKVRRLEKIGSPISIEADFREIALQRADLVVYTTSESVATDSTKAHKLRQAILDANKPPGTPRNLAQNRPDLLVVASGLYEVSARFGRVLDLPSNQIYACGYEGLVLSWLIYTKKLDEILLWSELEDEEIPLAFIGKPNPTIVGALNQAAKQTGMKLVHYQDPHTKRRIREKQLAVGAYVARVSKITPP